MTLVGVHGKARSGKGQFGEYLIECFKKYQQRTFTEIAFATPLKMMCKTHFGLSDDQLWERGKNIREIPDERFVKSGSVDDAIYMGDADLVEYWTPREIMQELGAFYRKIYGKYWVESLGTYMKNNSITDAIVTDVRHINECEYVKENKGITIRITRGGTEEIHGMDHESETALDNYNDFDIEIDNNSTLEDLYGIARSTVDTILIIERLMKKGEVYNGKE
jgi:hypothetical protein